MQLRRALSVSLATLATGVSLTASAQTTAGAGTVIMLPLVADIPDAYTTTVFVQNTNLTSSITVTPTYYFSNDAGPGLPASTVCNSVIIAKNSVATFDPYTQCNIANLPGQPPTITNVFGTLVLRDTTSSIANNTFYAYSRTAQPAGASGPNNGFSVEGFPVGNFSSATASAIGLQASTTAPHFRSNCFVAALNEQVDWQFVLHDGSTGAPIGNALSDTLLPYQNTRILDVFAAAGVSGTQSNVRATFNNSDPSAMVAYCTVETQDNGSADFRIAKSDDARDARQSRQACYGLDSCGATAPSATNPAYLNSDAIKNIHYAILDQPDFVQCSLISDTPGHLSDLEIMLRGPGQVQGGTPFPLPAGYTAAPYTSGGPSQTTFYVYTGERGAIASGATTRWYIDVSANQSSSTLASDLAATAPNGIPYGITCTAGNGMSVPWLGTTGPANP